VHILCDILVRTTTDPGLVTTSAVPSLLSKPTPLLGGCRFRSSYVVVSEPPAASLRGHFFSIRTTQSQSTAWAKILSDRVPDSGGADTSWADLANLIGRYSTSCGEHGLCRRAQFDRIEPPRPWTMLGGKSKNGRTTTTNPI